MTNGKTEFNTRTSSFIEKRCQNVILTDSPSLMLKLSEIYITLHFYLYYTKDKMKCRSNLTFSGGFTWITNNVFAICGKMQIRHKLKLQNTLVLLRPNCDIQEFRKYRLSLPMHEQSRLQIYILEHVASISHRKPIAILFFHL